MILNTSSTGEFRLLKLKNLVAKYRTCYATKKLIKFLAEPNYYFIENDWGELKDDRTATVRVNRNLVDKKSIVAKRYNRKDTWHAVRRTIRRSRGENCWIQAINLEKLEIGIAPPVAFIQEYVWPGIKGGSWYLYEFVDGLSLIEKLQDIDRSSSEKVMEEIVETLTALWKQHITHGDTKGTNFLLVKDRVVIIDLDAMTQHRNYESARRLIDKDVARFLRNWQDNPYLFELAQTKLRHSGFILKQ